MMGAMQALLYIGFGLFLTFCILSGLYALHPALGFVFVVFLWWLAFSDWNLPRRKRARRKESAHSSSALVRAAKRLTVRGLGRIDE